MLSPANRFSRIAAVSTFQDFSRYYRCVQILANEGLPEAIPVFQQLRSLYANLRGPRGPHQCDCPINETNQILLKANELVRNNKGMINNFLQNEKNLDYNLRSDIKEQDKILDE